MIGVGKWVMRALIGRKQRNWSVCFYSEKVCRVSRLKAFLHVLDRVA